MIWQKKCFENLIKYYFLNIIVNANFFSDLNITMSISLKYHHKQALNKKLKLMGGAMKYFLEKLLGMKYLALWSPRLQSLYLHIENQI